MPLREGRPAASLPGEVTIVRGCSNLVPVMIVVISHTGDAHSNEVVARLLRRKADVVLLDTSAFPRTVGISVRQGSGEDWHATAMVDGRRRTLAEARTVWWRRPLPFQLHQGLNSQADRAFAYGECHAAITGLWSCLDARWMNDPERDQFASRKLVQLKRAAALGLRVPSTCVTNDPTTAAEFIAEQGEDRVIYKSFSATPESWRETRLLRTQERRLIDSVRFAPVIFQEFIPAQVDVRITIVGDQVFAAAIGSQQTRYPHDFRMDLESARIDAHVLPEDVNRRLLELMASFGLAYGAVDMRLTPDGDYVFLEVNPSGQWLFIELRTKQAITDALCDWLSASE